MKKVTKRRNSKDGVIMYQRIIIVLIIALGVAIARPFVKERFFPENKAEITTRAVKLRLENVGELATQDAYVTSVNTVDQSQKLFGSLKIPFTQTKYVYSYDCRVKAGYDFEKIKYTMDADTKTMTFTMPKCKILSTEIDTDSFKVYHEQESIFTPITLTTNNEALDQMKKDARKQAIANGIKTEAKKNAETMLKAFVKQADPEDDYTYVFK